MSWQTAEGGACVSMASVCKETGLSSRTLRYYEELGLLPGVRRKAAGRRVYGPDEMQRLGFIRRLKALGLSLAEIKELNSVYGIGGSTVAMLQRLDDLIEGHLHEVDMRIAELSRLREEITRYRARVAQRINKQRANARGDIDI